MLCQLSYGRRGGALPSGNAGGLQAVPAGTYFALAGLDAGGATGFGKAPGDSARAYVTQTTAAAAREKARGSTLSKVSAAEWCTSK